MVANDNAGNQNVRGARESIASKPAPTVTRSVSPNNGLKELARFLQVPLISP
jgi:hypothetical protein